MRAISGRQPWSVYWDSVLATRAWRLQERLISTRLLLFGREQIFSECRTCCQREGIVATDQELPEHGGKGIEKPEHEVARNLARVRTDGVSVCKCMNMWCSIVKQ